MNNPKLKDVFLQKMTLAASRGCELISVRKELIDRNSKHWYENVGEIPLQTSSDQALTATIYKSQYEKIMECGDYEIEHEEIVRRTGTMSVHVYQITINRKVEIAPNITENLIGDSSHPDTNRLRDHLTKKIEEYSKDPGCAGVYVRSALTMRLLASFPKIEASDPTDYVKDVLTKAEVFLQTYGDDPIQTEYSRKRQEPTGQVTTFYEIYINDYDFSMMGKEPPNLATYSMKKCQVMQILLDSMNKMSSFDICKSLSLTMKDENDELIDYAELKF